MGEEITEAVARACRNADLNFKLKSKQFDFPNVEQRCFWCVDYGIWKDYNAWPPTTYFSAYGIGKCYGIAHLPIDFTYKESDIKHRKLQVKSVM